MIMSHWTGAASANPTYARNDGEMKDQDSSLPACAAELVDGKLALNVSMTGDDKEPMHTGKWSQEEMEYAEGLIDEFKAGNLALPDGFSLRQFLARMLKCSPKRISKRYEGNNYSKGRKFYVKSSEKLSLQEAKIRRERLNELERKYKHKLMQLKMPHLMIGNRTSEPETESSKLGQGIASNQEGLGRLGTNFPQTHGTAGASPGQAGTAGVLGLGDGLADQALMNSSLHNYLRMDSTNVLHRSLAMNPSSQLLNPMSAGLSAGFFDTSGLSRSMDDAGTLALLQQRDSQRLAALLDAQRRLNSNALLRANNLRMQPNLLAATGLMGDQTSALLGSLSNSTRRQSFDSELSQQLRIRQMIEGGQLQARNTGEQTISSPYAAALSQAQTSAAASLPTESLSAQTRAALPGFSPPQQALNPGDQLHSLLALQTAAADLGEARGQKRRASNNESKDNSNNGPRRRLN